MFTEAASLPKSSVQSTASRGLCAVPAVVVIAVDMEDLLALDGEHTIARSAVIHTAGCEGEAHPESTHSVRPGNEIQSMMVG